MKIFLTVSAEDSAQALSLGALKDQQSGQLFVPPGMALTPFSSWLPATQDLAALTMPPGRGLSLTDLLTRVSGAIKSAFPDSVWVRIEISQLQMHNGHLYIAAVDRDENGKERAKARAQIWSSRVASIARKFFGETGTELAAGIKVLVLAKPVFKPEYGFSLDITDIDPSYTLGDMEARVKRIRERLKAEGLDRLNKSLQVPEDFIHVGVISPPDAAGKGDFKAESDRLASAGLCRFSYFDAFFQGEKAKESLKEAFLRALEQHRSSPFCALVLIRGGGATADLHWLNEYVLAGMVCKFPCPVLVGIGHERDSTVLDEYAHRSFGTPSKVIAHIRQQITSRALKGLEDWTRIGQAVASRLALAESRAAQQKLAIQAAVVRRLDQAEYQASRRFTEITSQANSLIEAVSGKSEAANDAVVAAALARLDVAEGAISHLSASIQERAGNSIDKTGREVQNAFDSIMLASRRSIDGIDEHLEEQWQGIAANASRAIHAHESSIRRDYADVKHFAAKAVHAAEEGAKDLMAGILAHSIEPTLKRGFAIVKTTSGSPVSTKGAAEKHQTLEIAFRDGTIRVNRED